MRALSLISGYTSGETKNRYAMQWPVLTFIVIAELEEALQTATRVLGTHSLISMWQQHHNASLGTPLLLAYQE